MPFPIRGISDIALRCWYPYSPSRDHGNMYTLRLFPEIKSIEVLRETGSGAFTQDLVDAQTFAAMVNRSLLPEIARLEHLSAFHARASLLAQAEDSEFWWQTRLNDLRSYQRGGEIPSRDVEEFLSADALYIVRDGWAGQGGDPWRHIDALTGGCCNGLIQSASGEALYEATVDLPGAENLSERLQLVAITPRLPESSWDTLTRGSQELLAKTPRVEAVTNRIRHEIDAWRDARKPKLLEAIQECATLPDGCTWVELGVAGHQEFADPVKNQLTLLCLFDNELSRLNDIHNRMRIVGTFDDEGNLTAVDRAKESFEYGDQPTINWQSPSALAPKP